MTVAKFRQVWPPPVAGLLLDLKQWCLCVCLIMCCQGKGMAFANVDCFCHIFYMQECSLHCFGWFRGNHRTSCGMTSFYRDDQGFRSTEVRHA